MQRVSLLWPTWSAAVCSVTPLHRRWISSTSFTSHIQDVQPRYNSTSHETEYDSPEETIHQKYSYTWHQSSQAALNVDTSSLNSAPRNCVSQASPLSVKQKKHIVLVGLGHHSRRIYYPLLQRYSSLTTDEISNEGNYEVELEAVIDLQSQQTLINQFLSAKDSTHIKPKYLFLLDNETVDAEKKEHYSHITAQVFENNISKHHHFFSAAAHSTTARMPTSLSLKSTQEVLYYLQSLYHLRRLDGIIIANTPTSHMVYATFATKYGIDILMDKPLVCPENEERDAQKASILKQEFEALLHLQKLTRNNIIVQTQRRAHTGYQFVWETVRACIRQYRLPVTHVAITHSDGCLTLPHEWSRTGAHTYLNGMGKSMHSGYHFVDVLATALDCNQELFTTNQEEQEEEEEMLSSTTGTRSKYLPPQQTEPRRVIQLQSRVSVPIDHLSTIQPAHYRYFFADAPSMDVLQGSHAQAHQLVTTAAMGELDFGITGQVFHAKSHHVETSFSLSSMSQSFSQRSTFSTPIDTYKSNGRVRHETVNIHISPLMNIQIHSYQAHGLKDADEHLAIHAPSLSDKDFKSSSSLAAAAAAASPSSSSSSSSSLAPSADTETFPSPAVSSHSGAEAGSVDHFEVLIFRNTHIMKGQKEFERHLFGRKKSNEPSTSATSTAQTSTSTPPSAASYIGHNESARESLFVDFLQGSNKSTSSLQAHSNSNLLFEHIYTSITKAIAAREKLASAMRSSTKIEDISKLNTDSSVTFPYSYQTNQ